jgi:DNA helicase-2/ATP-dependent DNA helicase PcrA
MTKINELAGEIIAESSGSRTWTKINDTYTKLFEMLNGLSANGNDYAKFLLSTLELAYVSANELSDGKILNEWRDEYFTKDDETKLKILKDSSKDKLQKWNELAIVYSKYQEELISSSLYDYEDMLYMVTREIGSNVNLRNELEEKYQYIMVDEFQDTNDAQLDLIFNLTSSPVNEGNPNILVVGDDDQAIYKFQGAELDNITRFTQKYPKATTIVLDSNYRSTQDVLDYARNIILKANDRLETRNKNITKDLKSQNKEMKNSSEGKIVECEFKNEIDEYEFVATKVNELIQNGVEPHHISVISKKHDSLRDLSNIFNIHSIPYSYEKKEHVLDKKPIHELVTILKFIESGLNPSAPIREDLLPEILSYSFWGLSRIDIWKLAEQVKNGEKVLNNAGVEEYSRLSWLEAMRRSEDETIQKIAKFLINLIGEAQELTLEQLIDKVIGTKEYEYQGEYDDEYTPISNANNTDSFVSPFRNYYFGEGNFKKNKTEYLDFLFALRTFIGTLREFKRGEILRAKDIIEFLSIYEGNDNLTLTTNSPLATSLNAVILQTAHKAKGLEYPYVFIINSDEKTWNGRGRINKISFPKNLKLLPENDNEDDKIRLFYVSATRAKHTLYITHHDKKVSFVMNENSKLKSQST